MNNLDSIRRNHLALPGNAPLGCALCPRLVEFREINQKKYPDFFNGPVPAFGAADARLLIIGLAPGLKGANRTGRPFTGDHAGDLLYPTLQKFGFAEGKYDANINDSITLKKTIITTISIILALGLVAHNAVLSMYNEKKTNYKFAHNKIHQLSNGLSLIDSYHCSRYNTNTKRLTTKMFEDVFKNITDYIK